MNADQKSRKFWSAFICVHPRLNPHIWRELLIKTRCLTS